MRATSKSFTPPLKAKEPTADAGAITDGVEQKVVRDAKAEQIVAKEVGGVGTTTTPIEAQAPEVTRQQRELLEASRPGSEGVGAGKGVLGFRLGAKHTLEDVRARIAELKATSTDPMTSSHMAEVNPAELTHLDLQAFQAIVVDKSPEWKEKTPAFDAYFADVKRFIDERRLQNPRFDALKDTRENFGAFLRHVVIIHAFEERLAAKAAARAARGE
ncbi:MAG: hypothetical protein IT383_23745 [Deltaproteobacteria bacterium]|nr:hypothetical protein [Deltaproteobacteria bacterium]